MPERIVMTGATGVVGVRAIPLLVAAGHSVTAIGRSPEKRQFLESLGARAVELDMFDRAAAERALAGHAVVINLATHMPATTFKMMLPWSWRENDHVRREGSATLVDAALAAGVKRFIQESFAPVYEGDADGWLGESHPQRPARYNRTVLDAEHSAQRFTAQGGAGVVLRFAWFYGADPVTGAILNIVKKGWAPTPGRSDAYWPSVNHEDAASAVVAALGVAAGPYNVCDDDPLTRRELADVVAQALGVKRPRMLPGWVSAIGGSSAELFSRSLRMSNAKLKAASGWTPRWRSGREGWPAAVTQLTSP